MIIYILCFPVSVIINSFFSPLSCEYCSCKIWSMPFLWDLSRLPSPHRRPGGALMGSHQCCCLSFQAGAAARPPGDSAEQRAKRDSACLKLAMCPQCILNEAHSLHPDFQSPPPREPVCPALSHITCWTLEANGRHVLFYCQLSP